MEVLAVQHLGGLVARRQELLTNFQLTLVGFSGKCHVMHRTRALQSPRVLRRVDDIHKIPRPARSGLETENPVFLGHQRMLHRIGEQGHGAVYGALVQRYSMETTDSVFRRDLAIVPAGPGICRSRY